MRLFFFDGGVWGRRNVGALGEVEVYWGERW